MSKRLPAIAAVATLVALGGCTPQSDAPADMTGRWQVQEIAGASLGEEVDIWMEIDAEAGAISGFTGCNNFTARLDNFGRMIAIGAVSEEAGECANDAAATDERRFLVVLPQVQRRIQRGQSLELLQAASGSETLIKLRRDEPVGG
ncbi:MAG: META domain-containing protein [Hyphomonadaceae bacterium]|nr:META domain-containing protein [Hyphomonadaceae bacterium]